MASDKTCVLYTDGFTREREQFIEDTDTEHDTTNKNEIETWSNKVEYLLALIGYTVGIGSIWRFPIVCARNGGGAFIIPFVLLMILIGGPLYYLEICLGQFTGRSPCKAFEFCPILKGIGYLMVTMVTFIMWYYQTVMAWIVYYFYQSFSLTLPWSTCTNWWNTQSCRDMRDNDVLSNNTILYQTRGNESVLNMSATRPPGVSPAIEFWEHNVLRRSDQLEDFGGIQLHLSIALLVSWIIVLACLFRGVKSLGKVVYFTALFPYVLLTILLIRGITLDGSTAGLLFFCRPSFHKLMDVQVWLDASLQVFYSLGPIWGGVITMSAHNKFHQTVIREAVIVCLVDAFTALYAGLVVFSVLGFMAKQADVPIQDLALSSGHGLAFVVYPTAVSLMPIPQLWAVMFFLMMVLVMLDSLFGNVEVINATVVDCLPKRLKRHQVIVNTCVGIVLFAAGQLFLTKGGIHLFQLMDWYVTAFALLTGAFIEAHMIANIYGADRFSKDIELMTGKTMSRFTRIVICIVIPIFSIVTFVLVLIGHKAVTYSDGSNYKSYAVILGLVIGLLPIAVMCCVNAYQLFVTKGTMMQRVHSAMSPSKKWKPKDKDVATYYKNRQYTYQSTLLKRVKKNVWGPPETSFF